MFLNFFTTLHTAMKSRIPLSNTGSFKRQLVMYVNGIRNLLRTFPVAKSPHCVSRSLVPSGSGLSSKRSPETEQVRSALLQDGHIRYSVPKVAMRKEQSVNLFCFKFLCDFASCLHHCKEVLQSLMSCDVYKINSKFSQAVCCESSVLNCIRSTENTSSGRSVS